MAFLTNPGRVGIGGRTAVDAAGTAVRLTDEYVRTVAVAISADTGNTGAVAVGNASVVAAQGAQSDALAILSAGDELSLEISDPTKVYLDAENSGDAVAWCILDPGKGKTQNPIS